MDSFFPRLGVSACVWRQGRVLIVERGKAPLAGFWSLPGGSVEPGEAVREAALRELREETGVAAALDHLVGLFEVIRRDAAGDLAVHFVIACYTGLWTGGEAVAGSDAANVAWADPSQLGQRAFTPGMLDAIAEARRLLGLSINLDGPH